MPWNERLMAEELSPQTITLVIIVRLYLSEELPDSKCLLVFLARCLEGFPPVEDKEHLLNPTLLSLCQSITKTCQTRRQNNIKGESTEVGNPAVNTILLKILSVLWSINSADQLLILVNETYEFVTKRLTISYEGPRKVSQRSFIGRFSQRLAVSMKLLHFDESSVLFANFCMYRQSTSVLLKNLQQMHETETEVLDFHSTVSFLPFSTQETAQTNPDNDNSTLDEEFYRRLNANLESISTQRNSVDGALRKNITLPYMESLVETQIQVLQRHGTPTPQALRQMFMRMASSNFMCGGSDSSYHEEVSSVHYLTYLETLHSGDYRGAFDSLHRYFDYMVSKGSRYFYHFALVSKASLHQYFGENEKALDSIEEAISVARENKDNSTLVYILSWLFDFVRKNPSLWNNRTFSQIKNDLQLLDSLVRKSLSVSILLAAISYRSESEYLINNNACFAKYYESLFKSNFLTINDHVSSFIGTCHATSDLWNLVGFPHLENLYTSMGISYSEIHGTASDILEFRIRERRGNYLGGFEDQDLFPNGVSDAFKHRPLHYKFLFQSVEYSLRKGRIRLASEILNSLPGYDYLDQDSCLEKLRLAAMIESAHGNYSEALKTLDRQIIGFSNRACPLQSHLIHFLNLNITKSQILIQSGVPFRALSLTLQQMEIAKVLGFLPFLSKGCSSLVQVLNKAGSALDAYTLALSMVPLVFCINESSIISSIFYELAYLCLQFLREGEIPICISRKELFKQCLNFLSVCISEFKKSGDLKGLSKCFELESELSLKNFFPKDNHNTNLLAEFSTHSRKGLEILKTRMSEQSGHGYLERDSK